MQRRLTVILSADIAGYGALMERDEAGTLARVKAAWTDAFEPRLKAHGGRVVKQMGDGALIEFASVVAAVACAKEIQEEIARREAGADRPLRYRMGVNMGDVIVEGDDIFGEGVNVAARLQTLAAPGALAVSRTVKDHVEGRLDIAFEDLGEHAVKELERPVHVFVLGGADVAAAPKRERAAAICVLPFVNLSGDPEQEYFSDGVTEDIIVDLSKVSALAVTPRHTAFAYKGQRVEIAALARRLGVSHVLEGSVRKSGARVRITAQLVEAASSRHLWAERYDRDLGDIFALQSEISEAIVTALKLKLAPAEKQAIESRGTANAEAYRLYLMARQFVLLGDERHQDIVARICQRIVELDPGYARAWAMLSIGLWRLERRGRSKDNGRAAAMRAIELDPGLAEARAAYAYALYSDGDYDAAAAQGLVALQADAESYDANYITALSLLACGRNAEAVTFFEKSVALVDSDFASPSLAMQAYRDSGDPNGARRIARVCLERAEKAIALDPAHGRALGFGVTALAVLGEADRAKEWTERALLLDPDNGTMIYNCACAMISLGENDYALDLLELYARNHSPGIGLINWWRVDSDLDPIRDQPRFKAWLAGLEARHP